MRSSSGESAGRAVRQPGVALVEQDQPPERGETAEEARPSRGLPTADRGGSSPPARTRCRARPRRGPGRRCGRRRCRRSGSRGWAAVVAAGPSGPVFERWVLAQDPRFELAQLGPGLDPELLDQGGAQLAVCAQRVGLAAAAVQRQQALGPEPLTQRVLWRSASRARRSSPGGVRTRAARPPMTRATPRRSSSSRARSARGERKIAEVRQRRPRHRASDSIQEPDRAWPRHLRPARRARRQRAARTAARPARRARLAGHNRGPGLQAGLPLRPTEAPCAAPRGVPAGSQRPGRAQGRATTRPPAGRRTPRRWRS